MPASRRSRPLALSGLVLAAVAVACAQKAVAPEDSQTPLAGVNEYIVSADNVILNGRLFGAENDTVVILSHMRPNDQTAWFDFAEELAREGYAALTFNFRGYGDSQGDQDFDKLDDDLAAVIGYMRDRGKERIFLIGASMGGATSLVVAAQEEVDGVVAISAPARFEEQDALAAVPNVTEPKLFIASVDDEAALQFDDLVAAAAEPKESESYPGKDHGTDLFQGERAAAVRERILRFLDEHGGP
jgi:alpha-beta hydrolase superfamily lysophospholipase